MPRKILVGPADIRKSFRSGELTVSDKALASVVEGARGRVNPEAVESFLDLHPNAEYAEKRPAVKTMTIKVTKVDAKGKKRSKSVELPSTEVRALAGVKATRGRLSAANLEKAGVNYLKAQEKAAKAKAAPKTEKSVSLTKTAPADSGENLAE